MAPAAIRGENTMIELSQEFGVQPVSGPTA